MIRTSLISVPESINLWFRKRVDADLPLHLLVLDLQKQLQRHARTRSTLAASFCSV